MHRLSPIPMSCRWNRTTILLLLVHALALVASCCSAYRTGDAVGILLRTHTPSRGGATLEAYRHQLPRFGVSTRTRFDVPSLLNGDDLRLSEENVASKSKPRRPKMKLDDAPDERLRLSLSFDEGFHHLPWLDVYDPSKSNGGGRMLQNLVVTIVYSGSDGSIHAVHRETTYQDSPVLTGGRGGEYDKPKSFTVEYVWVNEADVDVQGGLLALFVAVLIVALSGMVGACTSSADDEDGMEKGRRYKEKHSSSSLGVGGGNSERFAKHM